MSVVQSMRLKADVLLGQLKTQTLAGMVIADYVLKKIADRELRVTSGSDGKHGGKGVAGEARDPHYTGRAFDFGIKEVPVNLRAQVVDEIRTALGPSFRVLWESQGSPNEHVHVQYEGPA